jgi:hypothetical protein
VENPVVISGTEIIATILGEEAPMFQTGRPNAEGRSERRTRIVMTEGVAAAGLHGDVLPRGVVTRPILTAGALRKKIAGQMRHPTVAPRATVHQARTEATTVAMVQTLTVAAVTAEADT